ncbi:MAG: 3-isopropylmalate dehydratase small subunit [Clostridia bacterium]|nr:3-isopropylmalate dehydratase small subunit [Clostridia bacterium]
MKLKFKGKVFKYEDNVNTDVIIPARYLNDSSEENLKLHCMEDIDKDFGSSVKNGDVVVAGFNFGCGSSREHAPLALKASGVKMVIAKSFARIFFRNAINTGLYIVENAEMADEISNGDTLSFDKGILKDLTTGREYKLPEMDPFISSIIEKGGLMEAIRK